MAKLDDTDYETLINSMTVEDAVEVLRNTRCYGTMDIAKSVILRALEQEPCEDCCNGNQTEKAKLCQKSYIAGMEHNRENEGIIKVSKDGQPSEDEKVIRIKKGTLKVRTGKYVVYDVEWLKKHFDTTEAKIYGQPQSEKRTEERTETHECDCISRKGHWIEHKHGGIEHIECSKCRCWFLRKDLIRNSYCPNCGSYNGGTK